MRRVFIYDTTLRDGAQCEGVSFSCEDKLDILRRLDSFGTDFVEGGWPGSNPRDDEFFARASSLGLTNTALTAFGSTRRYGVRPEDDANLKALASCPAEWCCIFGKSWDFQVTEALGISLEDNLAMVEDSVAFLASKGKRVMFDAEHFFPTADRCRPRWRRGAGTTSPASGYRSGSTATTTPTWPPPARSPPWRRDAPWSRGP